MRLAAFPKTLKENVEAANRTYNKWSTNFCLNMLTLTALKKVETCFYTIEK